MELIAYHMINVIHTRKGNLVLKQFKNHFVIGTLKQKLVLMLILVRNYLNHTQKISNAGMASKHALLMVQDVSPVGLVVLINNQKYLVILIWIKLKLVFGIIQEQIVNSVKRRYVMMLLFQTLIILSAKNS